MEANVVDIDHPQNKDSDLLKGNKYMYTVYDIQMRQLYFMRLKNLKC